MITVTSLIDAFRSESMDHTADTMEKSPLTLADVAKRLNAQVNEELVTAQYVDEIPGGIGDTVTTLFDLTIAGTTFHCRRINVTKDNAAEFRAVLQRVKEGR